MKQVFTFVFSFLSLFIYAQQKETHQIKIYLEDAETGKNIDDAKVTLEGFEIPPITGLYDKKGKFYYFDKIPAGYNTIMAYHKKYNEKGYQNLERLPKELNLKLYSPYRLKIPGDSTNFYKEDDFRIYILFSDTIVNALKTCSDFDSKSLCFAKEYIAKFHKSLIVKDELYFGPMGLSTIIVEKKDKKKFKRFNDPLIKEINADKNILAIYAILMLTKDEKKTYFDLDGMPLYIPNYIKYSQCDIQNFPSYIYSDFKEKLKNGLIKNNIYRRNKKEMENLSNSEQIRINKGELLNNFKNSDTMFVNCKKTRGITSMPNDQNYLKQYIATSDILRNELISITYKNHEFCYQINYDNEDNHNYKKEDFLIESKKTNKGIEIYKLKNNIASPSGTMDLIEYYNLLGIKIYQKIEKNITK
ncbi:hypothetical protein ACWA1F_10650 [Flavobacterium sp. 3-218]